MQADDPQSRQAIAPTRPARALAEARRARSGRKLSGSNRNGGEECVTGHPALFAMEPAFELGRMPEGGGYPVGFVELCARLMCVDDLSSVVHLCSGSVAAPLSFDMRRASAASCIADVRWLPIKPRSVRWIMVDPPYGHDYAEALWGLGKVYPLPRVLLRECAMALQPGGQLAFLHQIVPTMVDGLERVGTWGVYTGTETRMRALTIARRVEAAPALDLVLRTDGAGDPTCWFCRGEACADLHLDGSRCDHDVLDRHGKQVCVDAT